MKTFSNWSNLIAIAANKSIYIELSNGYYIPVNKNQLKKVANQMAKNGERFSGEILEYSPSLLKVSIAK